jgi:hypothetical protein
MKSNGQSGVGFDIADVNAVAREGALSIFLESRLAGVTCARRFCFSSPYLLVRLFLDPPACFEKI